MKVGCSFAEFNFKNSKSTVGREGSVGPNREEALAGDKDGNQQPGFRMLDGLPSARSAEGRQE